MAAIIISKMGGGQVIVSLLRNLHHPSSLQMDAEVHLPSSIPLRDQLSVHTHTTQISSKGDRPLLGLNVSPVHPNCPLVNGACPLVNSHLKINHM